MRADDEREYGAYVTAGPARGARGAGGTGEGCRRHSGPCWYCADPPVSAAAFLDLSLDPAITLYP